jgi:hypothetical protein
LFCVAVSILLDQIGAVLSKHRDFSEEDVQRESRRLLVRRFWAGARDGVHGWPVKSSIAGSRMDAIISSTWFPVITRIRKAASRRI